MPHNVVWNWSPKTAWNRHCSFLQLSLREFLHLQTRLLMEHLHSLPDQAFARQLLPGGVPASLQMFRRAQPLTSLSDYAPRLGIAPQPAGLPRVNASDAMVAGLRSSAEVSTLQPFAPGTPG